MQSLSTSSFSLKAVSLSVLSLVVLASASPALAVENNDVRRVLKHSAIGAVGGAVVGGASERSTWGQGAAVGAATGAATGTIDSVNAWRDNPLARSTAKGAVVGVGTSTVTEKSKVKGAAVGAGAGAGAHFLNKLFR